MAASPEGTCYSNLRNLDSVDKFVFSKNILLNKRSKGVRCILDSSNSQWRDTVQTFLEGSVRIIWKVSSDFALLPFQFEKKETGKRNRSSCSDWKLKVF